ncbi:hypothetical protein DESA109040_18965 [Deinococcus saxicola]
MQDAWRRGQWLFCVVEKAREPLRPGGRDPDDVDPQDSSAEPGHLWCSPRPGSPGRRGVAGQSGADHPADEGGRPQGALQAEIPLDDKFQAPPSSGRKSPQPRVYCGPAQPEVGDRHYLFADPGGLDVPDGGHGPFLQEDCRLGDAQDAPHRAGRGRTHDGPADPAPRTGDPPPLRPGGSIRQQRVSTGSGAPGGAPEHEQNGRMLGQRRDGELLRHPQDGTGSPQGTGEPH